MKIHHQVVLLISIFAICTLHSSCGPDLPIVVDPPNDIPEYHDQTTPVDSAKPKQFKESVDLYIDYSAGMYPAIINCYDLIDEIVTILNRNNTVYHSVGNGAPYKIKGDILDPTHLKNPRRIENYNDPASYLDIPIDSIIKNKFNQSIYITDFELYKNGRINPTAWATTKFESWLKDGNQIDVFAKEFINQFNKTQYLYILLFTPNGFPQESSLRDRFIKDDFAEKNNLEWFSFSDNIGEVVRADKAYDETIIYTEQEYESDNFGYYAFNLNTIINNKLFNNISLKNTSQYYKNVSIEPIVTDITEAYKEKKVGRLPSNEMFDISIVENDNEYTFNIKLSDKVKGLTRQRELYRIDFYTRDADVRFDNARMDSVLQWRGGGTPGILFSSLNKSLQEAVKRTKPEEKLLYTYYIEISL